MKLLVLGSGGQVGRELCRLAWPAGYTVAAHDRDRIDITRREAVVAAVARERPDFVINAAAYTAVDRAESEPDAAWAGNCTGPANLAAVCHDAGVPLIHLSTDYVFDGTKSDTYREDDPVNPLGVYGRSKEAGDRAVRSALLQHVIVRTAWVYSAHGNNFVKTMLRLGAERPVLRVVADQTGSPTSAADIAAAIGAIVQQIAAGNTNWGTCQKADIETHVRNGERKGSTSTFTLGRTTNWKLCWIPCELGLHIEPLMSVLNENNFRPVEAVTEIATSSVGYGRILGTDPSWGCGNE
jgi:dTDP-4-dehydrorhamnose reductase